MDPHYNGKPSMISETTWTRPNRFRSEAPLYLAVYGALQDSDAIISSNGGLKLDYGKGVLTINAPQAQGVGGRLKLAGRVETKELSIVSEMDLGHIVAVALDDKPLALSGRILLQVMSEEKATGFATEPAGPGIKRILNIGRDPWLVRGLKGTVEFKRPDAADLKVTALDFNGYPLRIIGNAQRIELRPTTVYYLISP